MPLLARVSDRYGRRIVIYAGLAGFAAGSALTGWAPTENWLVIGRTVQGVAGGALLPVTLALAADLFADRSRARVLGGVGAAQELGSVIGPLYGAWVASQVDWRWVFWINIPLAVGRGRARPSQRAARDARTTRPIGRASTWSAACCSPPVSACSWPRSTTSIRRTACCRRRARSCSAISGVLLIAFVVWEITARTKLMDLADVAKRPFFASIATSLLAGAGLLATLLFIQLDAQTVLEKTAGEASLLLARFLIALPIGAVIGGFLVRRFGERIITVSGLVIATFGVLADLALADRGAAPRPTTSDRSGCRCSTPISPSPDSGSASSSRRSRRRCCAPYRRRQHGIASAALVVARMMGMLIGVAGARRVGPAQVPAADREPEHAAADQQVGRPVRGRGGRLREGPVPRAPAGVSLDLLRDRDRVRGRRGHRAGAGRPAPSLRRADRTRGGRTTGSTA